MRLALIVAIGLLTGGVLRAQEPGAVSAADNPLAALLDDLGQALEAASVPFSPEQERSIVLMMEERRQASEALFGDLMDFRSGPTSGQDADRLQSAIAWMRGEFSNRVRDFLTAEQLEIWNEIEAQATAAAEGAGGGTAGGQTQFVRINNNAFSSETFFNGTGGAFAGGGGGGGFGGRGGGRGNFGGGGPEVIERGGAGAWHGNTQFLLQDEALNARNPFAANKPPYQERQFNVDVGGPAIPGRLTTNVAVNYNRSENVGTVRATLPGNEVFALGITRPQINRSVSGSGNYQVSDATSLRASTFYQTNVRENQGIGDFTLPERGSSFEGNNYNTDIRQFSALSATRIFESRLQVSGQRNSTVPLTDEVRINVSDAFNGGGAQNQEDQRIRSVDAGTLYTQFSDSLTVKAGTHVTHRRRESTSTENFGGTFSFSSLEAFRAGTPLNFRVNRGTPELEVGQLEFGAFVQTDIQLTQQFLLMLGLRHDTQSNLADYNNVSPRVSIAYGLGPATVLRAGAGLYYTRLGIQEVADQLRLDGVRQFEIVIDDPSYPDPFRAGSLRQTFPSVRVWDRDLKAPASLTTMVSLERTFLRTLLLTATYQYENERNRFRLRNLNAPVDVTSPVPRACRPDQDEATCVRPNPNQGNVLNLESTGMERSHTFRLSTRYRFSIFNASLNYFNQRTVSENPGTQLPTDNFDLRADRARNQNPRHQVNGSLNARLPFDVFVSGSVQANSGRYYTIRTGQDDNRDTNNNDRPPGVPRNSARGPKYFNVNFNASKAIYLGGAQAASRMNVNVFINLTNAFNRTHYGTPSGVLTSPNFGRSTSADDPREIEMGLRFQF